MLEKLHNSADFPRDVHERSGNVNESGSRIRMSSGEEKGMIFYVEFAIYFHEIKSLIQCLSVMFIYM